MTKSQSLERGLMVMELLNQSDRPMGTREIARTLDLSPAIVQRLINTLNEKHYVRRDAATKRYSIGYQVLGIGQKLQTKDAMLLETRKGLEALNQRMNLDAFMAVLQGRHAIYLLFLPGGGPLSLLCEPGQTILLHNTAIGKAILASMTDDEARELLGPGPLPSITPRTLTDPDEVIAQLAEVRRRGYAIVEDENITGITSVGALIGDPSAETRSAISMSFSPHFSPDIDIQTLADAVQLTAQGITRNLRAN
jgi:DNA-binding IclR family transcriptional regulator